MKKILIGIAATVVALFSACENLEIQEPETQDVLVSGGSAGTDGKVLFTATIGADTKTYLDWNGSVYKTVWGEYDCIYVIDIDSGEYEMCPIVEGAGTNSATFAGTIEAKNYVAFYGNEPWLSNDEIRFWMSTYQSDFSFPMVAESSTKSFSFQNLCSVLKVSVTGDEEYLSYITVRSNDEATPMAGTAELDLGGAEPGLSFTQDSYSYVEFYAGDDLSSTPNEYYIVLPAHTYYGGFTIELETMNGKKAFTVTDDIEMKRSHIRTLRVDCSEGIQEEDSWGISGTFTDDWADGADILMENMGGGWYMASGIAMESGAKFKLRKNGLWDGSEVGVEIRYTASPYFMGIPTNTRVPAYSVEDGGNYDMSIYLAGNYDIWFNPSENCVFVMSNGVSPFDLPTMDNISVPTYDDIYKAGVDSFVHVSGLVMAKSSYGFIVAVQAVTYNNVYVYDRSDLCGVKLGDWVDLSAPIAIYNDLPELVITGENFKDFFYRNMLSTGMEYNGETPNIVERMDEYTSTQYEYIKYTGVLDGQDVTAEGDMSCLRITAQNMVDLTQYDGQTVCVEGYYAGPYSTRHNLILKKLAVVSEDTVVGGSTEDIGQGESFPVTAL